MTSRSLPKLSAALALIVASTFPMQAAAKPNIFPGESHALKNGSVQTSEAAKKARLIRQQERKKKRAARRANRNGS